MPTSLESRIFTRGYRPSANLPWIVGTIEEPHIFGLWPYPQHRVFSLQPLLVCRLDRLSIGGIECYQATIIKQSVFAIMCDLLFLGQLKEGTVIRNVVRTFLIS